VAGDVRAVLAKVQTGVEVRSGSTTLADTSPADAQPTVSRMTYPHQPDFQYP